MPLRPNGNAKKLIENWKGSQRQLIINSFLFSSFSPFISRFGDIFFDCGRVSGFPWTKPEVKDAEGVRRRLHWCLLHRP